jgi:hypothetical protein
VANTQQVEALKSSGADKFHKGKGPDKGFQGADGGSQKRDGPVQFEKSQEVREKKLFFFSLLLAFFFCLILFRKSIFGVVVRPQLSRSACFFLLELHTPPCFPPSPFLHLQPDWSTQPFNPLALHSPPPPPIRTSLVSRACSQTPRGVLVESATTTVEGTAMTAIRSVAGESSGTRDVMSCQSAFWLL